MHSLIHDWNTDVLKCILLRLLNSSVDRWSTVGNLYLVQWWAVILKSKASIMLYLTCVRFNHAVEIWKSRFAFYIRKIEKILRIKDAIVDEKLLTLSSVLVFSHIHLLKALHRVNECRLFFKKCNDKPEMLRERSAEVSRWFQENICRVFIESFHRLYCIPFGSTLFSGDQTIRSVCKSPKVRNLVTRALMRRSWRIVGIVESIRFYCPRNI